MNATLSEHTNLRRYSFNVQSDGVDYTAIMFLDEKDKFIDDEISGPDGYILESEGDEGKIRDNIIDYLDKNWDSLVKQ